MKKNIVLFLFAFTLIACEKTMPYAPEENELLDGPLEGLTIEEQLQF